jgi:DNA-binding response OmpR family regulator
MNKKKVLIIEDREDLRKQLIGAVNQSGFEVYEAGDVASARQMAERHWGELDVLLLDMELEDPNDPFTTGADIAIEFRQKKDSFPPESLIYSQKNQIDYYRLALKLGAAAYLLKGVDGLSVVKQHVRVLALRRALSGENPEMAAEVARIAAHSATQSKAILTFCQNILKKEFESCLGVPFIILFTEENKTQNCADNADLPKGSTDFYHTLQALTHGKGNVTAPFILETDKLGMPLDEATALLYKKLNLAAFLPLSLSGDKRLSIGILQKEHIEGEPEPMDAQALCTVLAQYLRPTVLENVIRIWAQWTELHATRNSTAKLCLSVGQEIKDSLEAEDRGQLEDLANDLNDTGQYLTQLDSWHEEGSPISVKGAVEAAWDLITQTEDEPTLKLDLRGDCAIRAQRSDVEIIISRLLQWFIYRSKAVPLDIEATLKITCEASDSWAIIILEDNSHRLPKKLREDLFAPFTQAISTPFADLTETKPDATREDTRTSGKDSLTSGRYLPLYLAKMLVEGRYRGYLEDQSDEIKERSYGHRILMQFPMANEVD